MLVVLYLLNPLQRPLLEGLHKVSHVISHTGSSHQHSLKHTMDKEHSHEHAVVGFFSKLFSSEVPQEEKIFFTTDFDKHFAKQYPLLNLPINIFTKHTFFHPSEGPKSFHARTSQPPESFFS